MKNIVLQPARENCLFFNLEIEHHNDVTKMIMTLSAPYITTASFPKTYEILKQYLPDILHSTCFNESNLPFGKEVVNTEIGHLFEHIMLEYLTYYKLLETGQQVLYNGTTFWDWNRFGSGVFHIDIDVGFYDKEIFLKALENSKFLINTILSSSPYQKADSSGNYLLLDNGN